MKKIITTLLCIILTITIITEIIYVSISSSITEQSIRTSIKENLLTGFIYDEKGNKTEIFKTILRLTKLDENTVKKLMENETANNIITDLVNSIYDYNLTHDESTKYTKQQIIDIVNNNMDKILTEIDYKITPYEREEVLNYTKNNTDYIIRTIYLTDIGDYTR